MHLLPTTSQRLPTRFISRASKALALLCIACSTWPVTAQLLADSTDWAESPVPPPPTFSESRLVPVEMPKYMTLKFGVDPQTITITGDGVVRYVVVATNTSGSATNAFYEGVRCATDQYKTYARYNGKSWEVVDQPEWKHIDGRNSRYTSELASQGLCNDHAPRRSVSEIVGRFKKPIREVE